ncbi:hypothetical protein [Clostridium sp. DJ247]|uniref:hypothetical protein n=1 Tax=Clostridium sp. DJ247 TaxID=2726188 RepID=UPI0016233A8D|nr:hypothetical protein [Clostridium sp. DJ247]MBC2580152.1 hypothetical protein [Clostridium sp. DJ247]
MMKFLKSKWFIVSSLCLIFATIGTISLVSNRLGNNSAVVASNIDKNADITNETDKKQFYGSFMTEANWVANPSEPKNLLQFTEDNAIIKVKIKSIGEAMFFEKTTGFNNPQPFTPVEVIVEKSLDGQDLHNIKTVYLRGGDVKISDLMETLDQGTIEKMGLHTLTKEQQKTMYISYQSEYDYNLKPGEEYVLIVAKNSNNMYTIVANGYGIFKEDEETTSEVTSKNVLTKKELTDRNGKVVKHKK